MNAAELDPQARHADLLELHQVVLADYLHVVASTTAEQAAQTINLPGDTRTMKQLIGHFVGWDRFSILAAGDILAGVEIPRTVLNQRGFIDSDGQVHDFDSVDAFNDWHAERDSHRAWIDIQADAIQAAETLYALFADPKLLNAKRLERTPMHLKRLHDGRVIENIRMGWALWLIELQHWAVEHATELNL